MGRHGRLTFRQRFLDYLLQVSLILFGLIVATGVDRCRTRGEDDGRLQAYYTAIYKDLESELFATANNLGDAEHDVADLEAAIRLFDYARPDSAVAGLGHLNAVLRKGVFRTFSPTTFDVLMNTGDVSLITDLELRSALAGVFAYRVNIVRRDLEEYNRQTLETIAGLGGWIDPRCVADFTASVDCIRDPLALGNEGADELVVLLLTARERLFHLQMAETELQEVAQRVGEKLRRPPGQNTRRLPKK